MDAAKMLDGLGVSCEVIDVQTLSPFDINHTIVQSVEKTHALVCLDEDVPGGASAFLLQQILEEQGGWWHLDAAPRTIAASPNRPAYGPDGDYFTKPNRESIVHSIYDLLRERQPWRFPSLD
jgi:pyruvate/2-oxoglutarate/acetoin dehydrogenase E1 component